MLFVGLDAADPDVLLAGARDGTFPSLARLLATGTHARTRNPTAFYVGAVWPSFVTALSPGRHGRWCYEQHVPGTYRDARFRPSDLRGEPFWRALGRAGRATSVFDVPKAALDTTILGEQVCDWGTHDPEGPPAASPPATLDAVVARIGRDPLGPCDQVRRGAADYVSLRERLAARADARATWLGSRLDAHDAVVGVFSESHCAGHQAWHLHDASHERHDAAVRAEAGDVLVDAYRALDRAVGRLVDAAGPSRRALVLASHGMGPHHDGGLAFDAMLERLEALLPRGRSPSVRGRVALALDRRRTRRWSRSVRKRIGVGLPIPSRRTGRTAFAVPNNDAWAAVRVNLVGREPLGRIRPGPEMEAYLEALAARLAEVRNAATGGPAFDRILRPSALYDGGSVAAMPDLVAEWRRGAPIPALEHERVGRVDAPYGGLRTGDHEEHGLAIAIGPGIDRGGKAEDVRVEDLAPTLCAWLGVSLGGVDGRPIAAFAGAPRAVAANRG